MEPFVKVSGVAAPLDRVNVDTDQIIPKQFLKRIERTGFGEFLFFDWRYKSDGATPNPEFELNAPAYANAPILIAGKNFGCGSSREHAPWALGDYGFRAIIAPSYADIFYNNCFKNGILPVVLSEEIVQSLLDTAKSNPGYTLTVDLEGQKITDGGFLSLHFDVDSSRKESLLNGWDDIGLTLQHEAEITAFEKNRNRWEAVGVGRF
ncbi:MAG: 3-isopropylmalate dehydratase small subunit [Chthonomonadaceae bacterium]|nr:3-isopropylmalate dehydratase small subunit [Chthonomonadaceae bacterium]